MFLSAGRRVRLTSGSRAPALAVFLTLAAALGLAAPPANRAPVPEFGIVAFDLRDPVPGRLTALGVGVVRGSCDWSTLEPSRGRFVWDCADDVIVGAERLGIRSYMTVECTPAWANGGAGCAVMPADVADWYEFVRAFVSRYDRYHTILGIWNEPNLTLRDTADAANYARLFVNASLARNAVDRRFALAGPETSHHALSSGYYLNTVDALESVHALDPQDVISVHWYPDGPPLGDYIDAVAASGVGGANEVWLSEVGIATPNAGTEAAFYRSTLAAFTTSTNPRWTTVIFYRLWDGQPCCTESILNPDYSAKPAYDVLRRGIDVFRDDRRDRERRSRAAVASGAAAVVPSHLVDPR